MKCLANGILKELSSSNATWSEHLEIWNYESKYISALMYFIAFFLLLSNSMMMVGIWKTKDGKMSIPKKMFFSSAVCGLVTGLVLPLYGMSEIVNNGCIYQLITTTILNFAMAMDFTKLISVVIVRFIFLKYPLSNIITDKVLYGIWFIEAAATVTATATASSINLLMLSGGLNILKYFRIYQQMYGSCAALYCLIMVVLTTNLVLILRKRTALAQPQLESNTNENNMSNRNKQQAVKRLVSIASVFMCCNIPFSTLCFVMIGISDEEYLEKPLLMSRMVILTNWAYSLNALYCGINSSIYMFMDKRIVTFFKRTIKRQQPSSVSRWASVRSQTTVRSKFRMTTVLCESKEVDSKKSFQI